MTESDSYPISTIRTCDTLFSLTLLELDPSSENILVYVTSTRDNHISLYNVTESKLVEDLTSLGTSPFTTTCQNKNRLLAQSRMGDLHLFDIPTNKRITHVPNEASTFSNLLPWGETAFVVPTDAGGFAIGDIRQTDLVLSEKISHSDDILMGLCAAEGYSVISLQSSGYFTIWDLRRKGAIHSLKKADPIRACARQADYWVGNSDGTFTQLRVETPNGSPKLQAQRVPLEIPNVEGYDNLVITSMASRSDDQLMAFGGWNFNNSFDIHLVDPATPKLVNKLKGHHDSVTDLVFHNDHLISCSMDGKIILWQP